MYLQGELSQSVFEQLLPREEDKVFTIGTCLIITLSIH